MEPENKNGGEENALCNLPQYVTLAEAARLLRCSTKTLRRWIKRGRLRALRSTAIGSGKFLLEKSELVRLIRSMRVETPFDGPRV